MRLFTQTLACYLMLAGILAGMVWVAFSEPPAGVDILEEPAARSVLLVLLAASAFFWLVLAVDGTGRGVRLLRCHLDARYLQRTVRDLDSSCAWRRAQALDTVADFHLRPLEMFAWKWPPPLDRLLARALAALHRDWLHTGGKHRAEVMAREVEDALQALGPGRHLTAAR
jgi:hypothetical protein